MVLQIGVPYLVSTDLDLFGNLFELFDGLLLLLKVIKWSIIMLLMQIAIAVAEHAVDEKLKLAGAIEVVGVANPAQTYYASLKITQSHNRPVD